tara:strand:- start:1989 stop:2792 length:804 start_codon:yes stop_codon:yes gene_type:complete
MFKKLILIIIIILFLILLFYNLNIYESFLDSNNSEELDIREMKIYVINMEKSKDRKTHMINILNNNNLNYEFIEAVNGKELDSNYVESITKNKLRNLTRGEIGCFLSHKKTYNKLLDSHEDYCLILEDDVELCDNFVNEINNCLSQLNSFDIFYCYHYTPLQFYNSIGKDVKDYFPEKWDKNLPLLLDKDYSKDCVLSGHKTGTYGMIISKKAAKQLLNNMPTIKCPIDVQMHFKDVKKDLKLFSSKKNLVFITKNNGNDKFKSTIR